MYDIVRILLKIPSSRLSEDWLALDAARIQSCESFGGLGGADQFTVGPRRSVSILITESAPDKRGLLDCVLILYLIEIPQFREFQLNVYVRNNTPVSVIVDDILRAGTSFV
jgi:hypothetical protein